MIKQIMVYLVIIFFDSIGKLCYNGNGKTKIGIV